MSATATRLFFALWPDDRVRLALFHWQVHHLPDNVRWQHRADLHMTLHFLGVVENDRVSALRELAAGLSGEAFSLQLDQIGHWPRPQVLWAGPSEVPRPLSDLHACLGQALRERGFQTESRPYRPHVTLARKIRRAPAQTVIDAVDWRVQELALVASRPGSAPAYQPLARWPLD